MKWIILKVWLYLYLAFNPEKVALSNYKKGPDGKVMDRFNISDDWKYETGKGNISIKQTHGPVKLMHSSPAVKLHPQFVNH
jgi:hypothetical protein